jgi:hypothetical protein
LWGNDRTGIGTGLFADTVAPLWNSSYPTVTGVTGTGVTVNVSVNEDGTAYFVVLPSGADVPSSAQVKAGTDASDVVVAAGFSGSVSVDADTPEVMIASNLVSETDYDVYVVVEDLLLNMQSSPEVLSFTTLDITVPEWVAMYPAVNIVTGVSVSIDVQLDEDGIAYFVVLPDGSPVPSSAQVKAGTDASDIAVAVGFSGSVVLTGNVVDVLIASNLIPETEYDVYVVAEDVVPNLQATPVMLDVTTADVTDPLWVVTYPKVGVVATSTISVLVDLTESGNVYGVVLPLGSVEPTPAQVKAGTDASDDAVASGFSATVAVVASVEAVLSFSNMLINGDYEIYIIGEDASDNLMDTVVRLTATTLPLISKQKVLPSVEVGQIISISISSLVVVTTKDFPTIFKMAVYPGDDYEIVQLGEKVVEVRILGNAPTTRLISLKVGDGIVVSDEFSYKVQVVKSQRAKEKPISYGGTNVAPPDPFTPAFRRVQ